MVLPKFLCLPMILCDFCGPGPRFNIKMSSYRYRKSHCGDKTFLRPSYLHNGISYTGKTSSLYWIRALKTPYGKWPWAMWTSKCTTAETSKPGSKPTVIFYTKCGGLSPWLSHSVGKRIWGAKIIMSIQNYLPMISECNDLFVSFSCSHPYHLPSGIT